MTAECDCSCTALTGHSSLTRAPVIFSHSDARHFNNISRNAPDVVLDKIGKGKGKVDGVVMVKWVVELFIPAKQCLLSIEQLLPRLCFLGS